MVHDLVVVGGSPAGLSAAIQGRRAGLEDIVVLALPGIFTTTDIEGVPHLEIQEMGTTKWVIAGNDRTVEVESSQGALSAKVCLIDFGPSGDDGLGAFESPTQIAHRIHHKLDFAAGESDVLVLSGGEQAAVIAAALAQARARVVVGFTGAYNRLSMVARQVLEGLERDQRATVLWQARPEALWAMDGFPMVRFGDRRTPDLQFDHVVIDSGKPIDGPELEVLIDDGSDERVFVIGDPGRSPWPGITTTPDRAWDDIRKNRFTDLPALAPREVVDLDHDEVRRLAGDNYNATITGFDTAHNELWRIRVRPDREAIAHLPGQYCSLGLGYWEPRADDRGDVGLESKRLKMIRRSYSISSPIFDDDGYLFDPSAADEIELYVVWVRPDEDRVPELTPRLALKNVGDRIYLGPKVAGRYTVRGLGDPDAPVIFCATGTGEAPHNAMAVELLRKGHRGPILSVVSVRYCSDLAYLAEHRRLEERFDNYRYLPVPTREPDVPKRYLQDLLDDGTLEDRLGSPIDPEILHVFLCGNPQMIGLPVWSDDGDPVFPEKVGMAELLSRRGFTLDRRDVEGNLHYEEYW